jgi:hypothetical protein
MRVDAAEADPACQLLIRFLADYRAFADLQKGLFGTLNDKAGFFDLFDLSDDAAVGYDLIVYLELGDHFLQLLFLFFLRHDHEEIEDAENKDERQ